jgi:hypothetical protein
MFQGLLVIPLPNIFVYATTKTAIRQGARSVKQGASSDGPLALTVVAFRLAFLLSLDHAGLELDPIGQLSRLQTAQRTSR